jgi:hypothetical protein
VLVKLFRIRRRPLILLRRDGVERDGVSRSKKACGRCPDAALSMAPKAMSCVGESCFAIHCQK